jgi:hypothetical protein
MSRISQLMPFHLTMVGRSHDQLQPSSVFGYDRMNVLTVSPNESFDPFWLNDCLC